MFQLEAGVAEGLDDGGFGGLEREFPGAAAGGPFGVRFGEGDDFRLGLIELGRYLCRGRSWILRVGCGPRR